MAYGAYTGTYTVEAHHGQYVPPPGYPEGAGPTIYAPHHPWIPPTPRVQRMIRRYKRRHTTRPTPGSATRRHHPTWN